MSRFHLLPLLALLAGCPAAEPTHVIAGSGVLVRLGIEDPIGPDTHTADDFFMVVFSYPITCAEFHAWNDQYLAPLPPTTPEGFSFQILTFLPARIARGEDFEVDRDDVFVDSTFAYEGKVEWTGNDTDVLDTLRIETEGGKLFATVEGGALRDTGRIIDAEKLTGEHDADPRQVPISGKYELTICDAPPPPPLQ